MYQVPKERISKNNILTPPVDSVSQFPHLSASFCFSRFNNYKSSISCVNGDTIPNI